MLVYFTVVQADTDAKKSAILKGHILTCVSFINCQIKLIAIDIRPKLS